MIVNFRKIAVELTVFFLITIALPKKLLTISIFGLTFFLRQ